MLTRCSTANNVSVKQFVSAMKKLRIKQVRSGIGRPERQKRTLTALGFKRLNQTIEVEVSPQVQGMINKVLHLIEIVEEKK
ncbi:MAG: 50S ribosomal protein L30 [Bacteroidetes bacterium]|nr:MAG: 50S ribosomal protein L30 [Bacteroidota bacterium]RLD81041.1 MAG: 50S ribosomal protein L30 [Bacteroidota bacterium]